MPDDLLKTYRAKRDFKKTAEPSGAEAAPKRKPGGNRYLIQKHAATRLHYDLRLEQDGVLKSWAVTRGPSLDPADKRLAVRTEDHPLDYGDFEGTIPKGEYGGGTVMLWDEGTWEPLEGEDNLAEGKLKFRLDGARLHGNWMLVRIKNNRDRKSKADNWLLFKERDDYAKVQEVPITERALVSVRTGRTMEEIAAGDVEWTRAGRRTKAADPASKRPAKTPRDPPADALPMPKFVDPQLATLADAAPPGDDWIHEIKHDGYRAIAAMSGGRVRIYTRNGLDWTDRFARLVPSIADLPARSVLLDGEIAVIGKDGRTDFGALQNALGDGGKGRGLVYYLFDLLELDGEDLRKRPLIERKEKLAALLADSPKAGPLLYSDHVVGNGAAVFENAKGLKLEGIISKRADAPYRSDRAKSWLKVKTDTSDEFIVVGWEPSPVKGKHFAALLLATHEDGALVYRGKVGTGFGAREQERLWPELEKRAVDKPPLDVPRAFARNASFVKPELVVEVQYRGISNDDLLRQASFRGLRGDKSVSDVDGLDEPIPVSEVEKPAAEDGEPAGSAPKKQAKSAAAKSGAAKSSAKGAAAKSSPAKSGTAKSSAKGAAAESVLKSPPAKSAAKSSGRPTSEETAAKKSSTQATRSNRSPLEGEPVSPGGADAKPEGGEPQARRSRKGTDPLPKPSRSASRLRPPLKGEVEEAEPAADDADAAQTQTKAGPAQAKAGLAQGKARPVQAKASAARAKAGRAGGKARTAAPAKSASPGAASSPASSEAASSAAKGDPTASDPPADPPPPKRKTTIITIERDKDGNAIEIEGVRVTNPSRILFPDRKITKRKLIEYQLAIADRVLPHIVGRPLSLVRCPRGAHQDCFFQKHASEGFPTQFKPVEIREKDGTDTYLYIEDKQGLVAAVQMGALELHIWGSHVKTLEKPDRLVFDFDPDEEIPFQAVKDGAVEMRDRLTALGLQSFCMTTGGKGLHVVVPLTPKHGWDHIRSFAEAMARIMAQEDPKRYLAVMSKAARKGRIFIDYLRNARGATAIAPFSTRARKGAPVSWPITWDALGTLESAHPVSVDNYAEALKAEKGDPWRGYFEVRQVLPLGEGQTTTTSE